MTGLRNRVSHGKAMLTPLLLSAILFSCSKEDLQEQSSQIDGVDKQLAATAATYSSANLIFEETFEGSDAWYPNYDLKERFAGSHSFNQVTSPVFSGSKSGRFELRNTDELSSGTRAEVRFPEVTSSELHRWYSFALYLPSADYKYDSEDEVLNQWHQGSGYSPSISLRTKADKFWLYVKPTTSTTEKIDLGTIQKDKWNTFVYHIKHSSGSDGILELWINGNKVVNRSGANMYKIEGSIEYPRFNIGIYKSAWNGDNTSETSKRVLYYDQFRLGNEKATYSEMSAGTSTPVEEPETSTPTEEPATSTPTSSSSITSFTLVSANTEKDLITISNGATISLSKLGDSKLNIRANTSSSLTLVKFELSGAQSKTYSDKAAPFALHGDSGTGNYYYGNWNPPATGTYTLKATPYSGTTAGTPYTISFTITK
jgi:hypothetical protein